MWHKVQKGRISYANDLDSERNRIQTARVNQRYVLLFFVVSKYLHQPLVNVYVAVSKYLRATARETSVPSEPWATTSENPCTKMYLIFYFFHLFLLTLSNFFIHIYFFVKRFISKVKLSFSIQSTLLRHLWLLLLISLTKLLHVTLSCNFSCNFLSNFSWNFSCKFLWNFFMLLHIFIS